MSALPRFVLLASVFVYGLVGVAFVVAPAPMAALVHLDVATATADNDVRAVYGGMAIGLAVFFWMARSRDDWIRPGLVVVALTLGAMASARVLSWVVAGLPEPIGYLLHGAEIAGLLAACVALGRLPR